MSIETAEIQPLPQPTATWANLDKMRVGRFGEYFTKMALVRAGYDIFSPEVDDRAIDLVLRVEGDTVRYFDLQVKTIRLAKRSYLFMRKKHFVIAPNRLLALVILTEACEPAIYLIPSTCWQNPVAPFSSRDFGEGLKSAPEYGLELTQNGLGLFERYRFPQNISFKGISIF